MAENRVIRYTGVRQFLDSAGEHDIPNLILIHGEPYFIKQFTDYVTSFLLGSESSSFALETLEGGSVSMGEIIEQVSTFSFLSSRKVVRIKNIPLFQKSTRGGEISFSQSEIDHFSDFIEKGIPENHFLVLTAASVDKRKKIFKTIKANALIIDCFIPTGSRKAELDEQNAVLRAIAGDISSKAGKKIDHSAFMLLVDLTGFDPELFAKNLEKLIVYAGDNPNITTGDVKRVITRDKTDPIFNLSNALLEKRADRAIFYFNSLLDKGIHILALLKSLENQIRKMVMVKACAMELGNCRDSRKKNMGFKNSHFNNFKQNVLPKIIEYDKKSKKSVQELDLSFDAESSKKKTGKNDLILVPNPRSPYPVFQLFQKSDNFSLEELTLALIDLSDLDYQMKSSSMDAETALENFLITLCRA